MSSTRSVGMSLARRFNAGIQLLPVRVATIEATVSGVATRRENWIGLFPALKGRAKFIPTLRVESSSLKFILTLGVQITFFQSFLKNTTRR